VQELTAAVEKAIRDGADRERIEALIEPLEAAHGRLVQQLGAAFPADTPERRPSLPLTLRGPPR